MSMHLESQAIGSSHVKELLARASTGCVLTEELWEGLGREHGHELYSEAMYSLTRLEMTPEEARENLLAIVRHQGEMCAGLKRPVSLITATCDYFMQVRPLVRDPVILEVRLLQQKEEGAYRDELTGLFNRRSFNQELPREMERFRRFGQPFSLLMLDLDHFKIFNDTHGHSAGDQALRDVARILQDTARLYDRVVRYGGEEFAIILPQTSAMEALAMAERMREALAERHVLFAGQDLGALTVSIGLACFPIDALDMEGLVLGADQALYRAKEQRNCVRRHQDSKRTHPRYVLSDPLPFSILSSQLGKVQASALDLSLGGLSCTTDAALPKATKLHLVLSDSARAIHLPLQAEVRRVRQAADNSYQLGLSFRLENVEDQMKLMALLEGNQCAQAKTCGTSAQPSSA